MPNTKFADILKRQLEKKRWQGTHLCTALADVGIDVSMQSITHWLNGASSPLPKTMQAIASVLDVSMDVLLPPKP